MNEKKHRFLWQVTNLIMEVIGNRRYCSKDSKHRQ